MIPDLTTLSNFAIAWVLVIVAAMGWMAWKLAGRRPKGPPLTSLDQVRAQIRADRDRRESLRKASATEYGRRTDRR